MTDSDARERVHAAQRAVARGALPEALDLYRSADAKGLLGPDDLRALAEVAYAAGHLDLTITAWERVYAAGVKADDRATAAAAAARIAMHLLFDTALMAPVRGWLGRAERLLEDHEETAAHAWVAVVRSYERILGGDTRGAHRWTELAIDIGTRLSPAAAAIGRVARARLLILDDNVAQGMALLDEVGVSVVSGDLDPLSTGVVYCELVCTLQGLAQYDLAEQWTEAMERWSSSNAVGSLHGRCRVHRAEILRLRGCFDEAEREAMTACDELRPYLRRELGWPLNELGLIRLRRGDLEGARQALLAAHHAGWSAQPGLALVKLAEGNVTEAATAIREALDHPRPVPSKERPPNSALERAPLLEAQVEIGVAAGEHERAREAAEELEAIAQRFESKALFASAALSRGRVDLATVDARSAEHHLAHAVRLFTEVGAPYKAAVARSELAKAQRASGREHLARLEDAAARASLDRMSVPITAPGTSDNPSSVGPPVRSPGARYAFRQQGDFWSVGLGGRSVLVRNLKGMRYLARLLARPGQELHVLDLVALERVNPSSDVGAGSSMPVVDEGSTLLDQQAKTAYRRRLIEIEEDIEAADARNDHARVAHAKIEQEFLMKELSRAFGLGGRARRPHSASERARVGVTRALRKAVASIREHDHGLAEHLDRAIQTGTYCAYLPDPHSGIEWDVDAKYRLEP